MSESSQHRTRRSRRLFRFGGAGGVNEDVATEMNFHLDSRVADLCHAGMSPEDARVRAEREFGDIRASKQELAQIDQRILLRQARAEWMTGWQQDLTIALRGLRRRPGFSATVIATLALGIGATTAVFSLANATLLSSLPYRAPDQLVHVWETRLDDATQKSEASYPNLRDWRSNNSSFVALDGYNQTNLTLSLGNEVSRIRGVRVTSGFLATLGVRLAKGRDLSLLDEQQSNGAVVIITDQFWRNQLGARPDIVGQHLMLDGAAHSVIGVLPREFHFVPGQDAAVWLPVRFDARSFEARGFHWLNVVGRMRDGIAQDAATKDLVSIMQRLAVAYPESNAGRTVAVKPLREVVDGDVRPLLLLLLAAAAMVLLIACVNVAGLLLSRSVARTQEIAVRGALGASRTRMARTLLTESMMLAMLGGALGVAISVTGVRVLTAAIPEGMRSYMPRLADVHVDLTALLVTGLSVILCGVGAGILPALNAGRLDVATLLRQGGRTLASGASGSRTGLIVAEIALTVVLLVGTGLLGRSMLSLMQTNFGFDGSHVLTGRVALAGSAYQSSEHQQQYFEQLLARLRTIPGVTLAGAVSNPPFNGGGSGQFRIEGEPERAPADRADALIRGVAGDYFQTLRIAIVSGRAFMPTDDSTRPRAVIINASLAKQLFKKRPAVGRQLRFFAFDKLQWTIVGVVADVTTGDIDQPAPPTIYMTHLQAPENRVSFVIRSAGDPVQLANRVRAEARGLDPQLPVYGLETMTERIQRMPAVSSRRFPLVLIGAFSASALLLAVVGIYGLIAQLVTSRTREFGIRRALGAGRAEVMSLVVRQGVALAVGGIVAGSAIAVALTRFMNSLLFGVSQLDALTYAAVVTLMLLLAVTASMFPARRAANVDPVLALRSDD